MRSCFFHCLQSFSFFSCLNGGRLIVMLLLGQINPWIETQLGWCVTPCCVIMTMIAELVSKTVCLRSDNCWSTPTVGDILLSWEYWRASYWDFLFSGFDCRALDNLNEEPRSVLQDGSLSSQALGRERHGSRSPLGCTSACSKECYSVQAICLPVHNRPTQVKPSFQPKHCWWSYKYCLACLISWLWPWFRSSARKQALYLPTSSSWWLERR